MALFSQTHTGFNTFRTRPAPLQMKWRITGFSFGKPQIAISGDAEIADVESEHEHRGQLEQGASRGCP